MAKRTKKRKLEKNGIPARDFGVTAWSWRDWIWALILLATVFVAYGPVWRAGYLWDDDLMVTANPCIVGPLGLTEIWTTVAADICPLTLTTFWFEHALWGLAPLPYHLVNVLMHGLGAVALWRVLRALEAPGAWLGAAVWALHPVQAESVAWITEMKNTQSGLFFLLAILFFLRMKLPEKGRRLGWNRDFALMLLFAFLAMASKSSTILLPIVLCLCAWWREREAWWRRAVFTLPVIPMTCIFGAVSIWTQGQQTLVANDPLPVRTWPERLLTAGDAIWFYLDKLIWPHPLTTIYPPLIVDAGRLYGYLPLISVAGVLLVLWQNRATWARPWFFAFTFFLIMLFPVLGVVDNFIFRYSLVFDHFQYLASMGPLALAGALVVWGTDSVQRGLLWPRAAMGVVILLVLGGLTWQRAGVYESQETLWADALRHNPNAWIAHSNFAQALAGKGSVDEAITEYETALKLHGNSPETHYDLGAVLFQKGEIDEATAQYRKAIELYPTFAQAHYALGNALAKKGLMSDAIPEFRKAVELNPANSEAHNDLGAALFESGQLEEAQAEFQEALQLNARNADAQSNLAKVGAKLAARNSTKP